MDEKSCFSKEAPAFDAKDISQALGKATSPEGDRSRVYNVLSLLSANVSNSLAEQMTEPSPVNSTSGLNFSEGSECFVRNWAPRQVKFRPAA